MSHSKLFKCSKLLVGKHQDNLFYEVEMVKLVSTMWGWWQVSAELNWDLERGSLEGSKAWEWNLFDWEMLGTQNGGSCNRSLRGVLARLGEVVSEQDQILLCKNKFLLTFNA